MVWSNLTATKCRGLVSLNQVIKEIVCLQPLKSRDLCLVLLLAVLLLLLLVAPCLNCLEAVKKPDRKSGSAGMPRPISYAVFCLKKKNQDDLKQDDAGDVLATLVVDHLDVRADRD